jgi:uncharacterized membrane protein
MSAAPAEAPAAPNDPSTGVATMDDGPVVSPANEDDFVRGMSQAIGGPLGAHAVRRRTRWSGLTATIIMLLATFTFGVHWLQKYPCQDGAWVDMNQYKYFCYADVLALYYAEELSEGKVPYFEHLVEYPVLTGAFMGVLGLPVDDFAATRPGTNEGQWFYNINAIVLFGFGLATVAIVLALRRRRPWDAAMLALAPALFVTATVNWDLFAIGLTAMFMLAWARRWPWVAGMMLGLAVAAKFYPLFLAGPLLLLAIRSARWKPTLITLGTAAFTWVVVNAPVYLWARPGWNKFWELSDERGIDWGTLWYIGAHFHVPGMNDKYGIEPFTSLGGNIDRLNLVYQGLFVLGCVGIGVLTLLAPRRPRFAQLCFLVVAVFLLTSKVWSQQFCLWLIPLAVLARPKWTAFLAWQAAELLYFVSFYGELMGASGKQVFEEWVFVWASIARWTTLAVLVGLVVREILRPEQDVVRQTYLDDPDGGPFDGAPEWPVHYGRRLRSFVERLTGRAQPAPTPPAI